MLDKLQNFATGSAPDPQPLEIPAPSPEVPSYLTLERDEDNEPLLARMTYVDETTCIGCKNCAMVARNTFFMEEDYGKARVFGQGGDSDDLIDEAIDSCPVNCIHYVSHEDLVILERERIAREGDVSINNYGNFKRAFAGIDAAIPETKAKHYGSLSMGTRCNNCPGRGCAECPMFGVGENPEYQRRVKMREEKRAASGATRAAEAEKQRASVIDELLSADYNAEATEEDAVAGAASDVDSKLDSLFSGGYSFDDAADDDDSSRS